jgi:hypothetical protein
MQARTVLIAIAVAAGMFLSTSICTADEPWPAPASPRYRSPAMRTSGMVLTAIASAHLVAGFSLMGAATQFGQIDHGGGGPFPRKTVTAITGIGFLAVSGVLYIIGVPLWVVGAKPPEGPVASERPGLRWAF